MTVSDQNNRNGVSFLTYILSLLAIFIIGVFLTLVLTGRTRQPKLMSSSSDQAEEENISLDTVAELYQVLTQEYYGDVDSNALINGALEGMAQAVDDPHTQYMDVQETSDFNDEISGSFEGIGAEVIKEDEKLRVVSPIPDSPADQAGILPNDYILAVDGQSLKDLNAQEAVELIRGPKGSEVDLEVERSGNSFNLIVERDAVPIETVTYQEVKGHDGIGLVQLSRFNQPSYEEMVEAIQDLEDQGVTQFIFDLRGNPGGLLDTALQIANIFVDEGDPIMQVKEAEDEDPISFVAGDEYGDFKFNPDHEGIFLVDEGSASASEILAGAVQEAGYPLLGKTTYGKGTVQSLYPLIGGSEVKFTNHIWLTASGEWINEEGIEPDIEVDQLGQGELKLVNPEETYQLGDQSPEVENINKLLSLLGYEVPDNDQFSQETQVAVQTFQNDQGLEETGVMNETTSIRLMKAIREYIRENDKQVEEAIARLEADNGE